MATPSVDPPALTRPLPDPVDYSENDDEVDQLDSDSDVVNHDASSVSSQKEGAGERLPGHSLLPVMRLENIIQADGKCSIGVLSAHVTYPCQPRRYW